MSITFAIIVSSILFLGFIVGAIWLNELAEFCLGVGFIWVFLGLGLVGTIDVSPSYPTSIINVKIVKTFEAPDHSIRVFCEGKREFSFSRLKDAYLLNAKEMAFETGRKNLWGWDFDDLYSESHTRKLNNQ